MYFSYFHFTVIAWGTRIELVLSFQIDTMDLFDIPDTIFVETVIPPVHLNLDYVIAVNWFH